MRDPRATVVCQHFEAPETERMHQLHHVLRHFALAVRRVIHAGVGRRLIAVTIAAQISRDDTEMLTQHRLDLVPDHVRLRVAVQQQQRRLAAVVAHASVDSDAVGVDALEGEVFKHPRSLVLFRRAGDQSCADGPRNVCRFINIPKCGRFDPRQRVRAQGISRLRHHFRRAPCDAGEWLSAWCTAANQHVAAIFGGRKYPVTGLAERRCGGVKIVNRKCGAVATDQQHALVLLRERH